MKEFLLALSSLEKIKLAIGFGIIIYLIVKYKKKQFIYPPPISFILLAIAILLIFNAIGWFVP